MSHAPFAVEGQLAIGERLVPGAVVVESGRIREVLHGSAPAALPVRRAHVVSAGLIDLQVNGAFGHEVGADAAALKALAARLPSTGVTGWLPTLVSSPAAEYAQAFAAFAAARGAPGALALGLHLEGPYIAMSRAGAHRKDAITAADALPLERLLEAGATKLMTLAPEVPGALERIAELRRRGVVVSLGHTEASFEQVTAGIEAGATMATHLYNAMSPFSPRAPGTAGAVLSDPRIVAGLIADGVHCHPSAVCVAIRAKGFGGICLVSDAMAAAGMGAGEFALGGLKVIADGRSARLENGTLAGSTLTMDQAIRNVVAWGFGIAETLSMATLVPARLLGLTSKGRIEVGADADLVLWSEKLEVVETYVVGVRATD